MTNGLTIGFWQNNNGQRSITNAGAVSGTTTCRLTPLIRAYAPFTSDLAETANCAAVAEYAVTVIKAASAAGDDMSPMLKAQMLATTFSSLLPNANLQAQLIDLSYICKVRASPTSPCAATGLARVVAGGRRTRSCLPPSRLTRLCCWCWWTALA